MPKAKPKAKLAATPKEPATSKLLGMLYEPYKPAFFYFELVDLWRKLLLIGFAVFLGSGSLLQLVVAVTVATCFLVVETYVAPHHEVSDGQFATVTGLAVAMTLLSCLVPRPLCRLADRFILPSPPPCRSSFSLLSFLF